ncbi:MAG: DUF4352 domain-containing protein, partial [Microthrixaceae bacterium]
AFAALLVVAVAVFLAMRGDGNSADSGTRDNPLAMGTSVEVGNGWLVTVNSANTSANTAVAAAEAFNDPPESGKRYVVVNLSATNNSAESDSPEIDVSLFGASGEEHDGGNLVTPPEPRLDTVTELDPGQSTEGNLVFVVDSDESDLALRLQPLIAVDGDQSWVALGD